MREEQFLETSRKDFWWLSPLAVFIGLSLFGIYSAWAAFQGEHYQWGPYLSPFYSPLIVVDWWKWSPAFLILWAPAGFRATCYYYRKAYYRAFFLSPPACAVGDLKIRKYKGETNFPFIFQNIHRCFLYLALIFIVILWIDVYHATRFENGFGIGAGTLVLFANTSLLSLYTFSCHSLRHLVGGRMDCFSKCGTPGDVQHKTWEVVSCLNKKHMLWAWLSLFMVGFSDLYVRLVSMGIIKDFRIF
ncbi:MAG: succinate dehydrogenase [Deltaproteobacteria bacterium]|nr:succinate dehydrogenase [Deltaproteobacteria bacterium]